MTIYSQHPNRGKTQILATYRGSGGVQSVTVTSVDDAVVATRIVGALNEISACATAPLNVRDHRDNRFASYPFEHLAALTDRDARASLLVGTHSLWYEHVKLIPHQALTDLDDAVVEVPAPVRTAIAAELEKELHDLRDAWAEFTTGVEPPAAKNRREWDSDLPFILFGGGIVGLSDEDRERLDRLEQGAAEAELTEGVDGMRRLIDAYLRCTNPEARLVMEDLTITDDPDPFGPDRYFLDVLAPLPSGDYGREGWSVEISWWELDSDGPDASSASGETVLRCAKSTPPTVTEIVELLDHSGGRPEQLRAWATTPVGELLAGTTFVVTKRYDLV